MRIEKVCSLIKVNLSIILTRKLDDSRIGFISIIDVNVSKDLAHAWVYYSQIGSDKEKYQTKQALNQAAGFLRKELAAKIRLKTIPELHFIFDASIEKGSNILDKMDKL